MADLNRRQIIQAGVITGAAMTTSAFAQKEAEQKGGAHRERTQELAIPEKNTYNWGAEGAEAAEAPHEGMGSNTEEFTEGPQVAPEAAQQCVKNGLFKIRGWPEFKTEMKRQCRKTPFGKVCVNLPQLFVRDCELSAFAEVCHPEANAIRDDIAHCVGQAVAAGVITGLVTGGNLAAAAAALKAYLTGCLAAKLGDRVAQLSVTIRTESTCGNWKPR